MAILKSRVLIIIILLIGTTALSAQDIFQAAEKGDLKALRALLENNPSLAKTQNANKRTPLHLAVENGHKELIVPLVRAGADPNAQTAWGDARAFQASPGADAVRDDPRAKIIRQNVEKAKARLGDRLLKTADEVIAGHVAAVGGSQAIRNIKTLSYRGRNLSLSPSENPIIRYYKQPDFFRQQSPGAANYILSEGGKVFMVNPEGRAEMTQAWAKPLSRERIDGNFLDYTERGIVYEYLGLHAFDTEPSILYHLKRTFPDGYYEDLYFDIDRGLLRMIDDHDNREPSLTALYEYRDVGGILFPHLKIQRVFSRLTPPHIFVVDEVKVNDPLADSLFK